jgi:hypothetical protein
MRAPDTRSKWWGTSLSAVARNALHRRDQGGSALRYRGPPYPAWGAREDLVSVAGTSALVAQERPQAVSTPESVHPKVVREFSGMTADEAS